MASIFLCWSFPDEVVATRLAGELRQVGHAVWLDPPEPDTYVVTRRTLAHDVPVGETFREPVLGAIREADVFLLLVSPDSVRSELCRDDLMVASRARQRIIPVIVRDVENSDLPVQVQGIGPLHLRHEDDFEGLVRWLVANV
jgi:TIR domain